MTKFSLMRLSVWSWPRVSFQLGEYVSMRFAYIGPFCLLVRTYHIPYKESPSGER